MSKAQLILDYARENGIISAKEMEAKGIHREYLRRFEQQGLLTRSARGIYTFAEVETTENHTLAETAKRFPKTVVCLLSVLSFYQLTTQTPYEIWLAVSHKQRPPKDSLLPLRIFYMSGQALEEGIEEHLIEGVTVRMYSLAKTVADCFKFRHKIGLDVAIEALRECRRERRCTIDELWHYAKICRIHNIMRPYLNSIE
jgi:predicted transcriptional regulator of viral defense system